MQVKVRLVLDEAGMKSKSLIAVGIRAEPVDEHGDRGISQRSDNLRGGCLRGIVAEAAEVSAGMAKESHRFGESFSDQTLLGRVAARVGGKVGCSSGGPVRKRYKLSE